MIDRNKSYVDDDGNTRYGYSSKYEEDWARIAESDRLRKEREARQAE